ncbi:MAG: RibD family protein [Dehalococcoidia bacterium]|nr:RibD family protein [Dehalococcoidia bacterium]
MDPSYVDINFINKNSSRPYLISNMIISSDGNTLFTDGESSGLGSEIDKRLMGELRYHADVVLNGAETLRICGSSSLIRSESLVTKRVSNGKTAHPIASVLTNSGKLPLDNRFFTSNEFDSIVFLDHEADSAKFQNLKKYCKDVVPVPKHDRAVYILEYLKKTYDASVVLLEGGPSINGIFFEGGLIDEYFITISPQIFIPEFSFTSIKPNKFEGILHQKLDLIAVQSSKESGEIFLRYKNRNN